MSLGELFTLLAVLGITLCSAALLGWAIHGWYELRERAPRKAWPGKFWLPGPMGFWVDVQLERQEQIRILALQAEVIAWLEARNAH